MGSRTGGTIQESRNRWARCFRHDLSPTRSLIDAHVSRTGSQWGQEILEDLRTFLPEFWVVKPKASELGTLIESLRQAA